MTRTFSHWFGWFFSTTDRAAPQSRADGERPMKIEVERLPDYLWRELGFPATLRPEDDPWRQVQ